MVKTPYTFPNQIKIKLIKSIVQIKRITAIENDFNILLQRNNSTCSFSFYFLFVKI